MHLRKVLVVIDWVHLLQDRGRRAALPQLDGPHRFGQVLRMVRGQQLRGLVVAAPQMPV